ncbi:MAG: DEAD/DEAH box helicase family protein [Ktedonobacterales bacterium]|nr:DEAD/DEAH box helicase family protein [Ktedonobacterales bacterium]
MPKASATIATENPQERIIVRVQAQVAEWVAAGYPGASELTLTLLRHWFAEPHLMPDGRFFQWYAHQRRAVETAIYLYEVKRAHRSHELAALVGVERVPQRDPWPKLGLQLATGAGKTKVLSLLMTWAHLHWALADDQTDLGFGGTQLLIAPNLIVLERLLSDFRDGAIFANDPLIPAELRRYWNLTVFTAESVPAQWRPGDGYLVVTNIHKVYPREDERLDDDELPAQLAMFERATPTQLDLGQPRLLEFLCSAATPIAVFNDEAHHVHDEPTHYPLRERAKPDAETRQAQGHHKVLLRLHDGAGLALQTDVSATLFEETTKAWFRHTVYNYPLSQAIGDGVVKRPYLARVELRYKAGTDEPIPLVDEAATNAWDRYHQLIQAGIAEWKKEQQTLDAARLQRKTILFIVCNNKAEAHQVAERLGEFVDPESGELLFADRVKELHIGLKESTNDREWERIRAEVNAIDEPGNPYTAVVSVMMLKEGWDVRNVKVIVPLRPCDSRTLTEQILGRGLRRMFPPYWSPEGELKDRGIHEGLYVIKHPSFAAIINQLQDILTETEPMRERHDPTRLVISTIEPEEERARRDLPIPQITGAYETTDDWVEKINRHALPPLASRFPWITSVPEIEGILRHSGIGGERIQGDEVHFDVQTISYASIDAVISAYAEAIRAELRLSRFYEAAIKAIVKSYLERCVFALPPGVAMNLDSATELDEEGRKIVLANIQAPHVKQQVVTQVGRIIGAARTGQGNPEIRVSIQQAKDLRAFEAVPRLALRSPAKCVFDACCFDVADELRLAEQLDEADDVAAWLWNDQTGVGFRMQYAFEGRTPYYYPDFLVRLADGTMWVVETKGSIRERDRAKQARAERYVDQLTQATGTLWHYLFLVNDSALSRADVAWWANQGRRRFSDLVRHVESLPNEGTRWPS